MTAKTIIITGASDGIGAAAARELTAKGHEVVIVGHSAAKTEAVARELGADFFLADFSKLSDVRDLAATLLERYPRIDVLANNAGGIMGERELTVDGFEKTLQVNHLAPFLLTNLLIDRLIESRATVINTASVANVLYGNIDIDDLGNEKDYSPNKAYGDGKLENILVAKQLDARYGAQGVSAASFHPGVVATNFAADTSSLLRHVYNGILRRFLLSSEKGADTLVWLATSTPGVDWKRGGYFAKRKPARQNKQADDVALQVTLWEKSVAMTGLVTAP